MKKILLFVILTMCAGIGIAQPSLSSRISTLGTLNRTYYLYDTGFRRQNVMKHFRINDSLIHYDSIIAATVVSGHDLDATLTLGNESDLFVNIRNSGLEFKTYHTYSGLTTLHDPTGSPTDYPVTFIGREAGYNVMYLRDAFGYFGYMGAGTLTADRKVLLPDEGDGVGLDATLVTHTTGNAITVSATGSTGTYAASAASIDNGLGSVTQMQPTFIEAANTSGTVLNRLDLYPTKLEYKYVNSVGSISKFSYLHFDRPTFTSGTQDVWFPSATNDTLAVKGDITAMGNFATADLTLTGTRAHHMDRYGVSFDSTLMWKIIDTSGNYLLSLNDTTTIASFPMFYASTTPTQKRVRLNAGGTNSISMVRDATQCIMTFTTGNTVSALDSTTNKFGVTHLGGLTSAPTIAAGTGAGTAPTVSVGSGSTDLSGYVNITTGTTCATDATVVTVTFSLTYASAPKCIILSPANKATQNLAIGQQCFVNQAGITTAVFNITSNTTALTDATAYQWYYTVIQ